MTTQTLGLSEFLLARIAEDEERATRFLPAAGPARVLAECAAKRRIVEMHSQDTDRDWCLQGCGMRSGWTGYPCDTLKALAAVYDDHPDYRAEWAL